MSRVLEFPEGFKWGTSTAAAQIETASEHNWKGVVAIDGAIFDRTTDHEKRRDEDIEYISRFGTVYRCGVDWARLQLGPKEPFQEDVIKEYRDWFDQLRERGMEIMFVIHHFTHPLWLENKGGWTKEDVIPIYVDFAQRCVDHFGDQVAYWNTFNEPNVYALNGFLTAHFPPFRKNYFVASRVIDYMGKAHDIAVELIKAKYPDAPVGISLNTGWFDGLSWLGKIPAKFIDWWFHTRTARRFEKVDFWGLSYYAYVPFKPGPITEIDNPGELAKLGFNHDQMWGYRPEGLGRIIRRIYAKYKKPIIVTENGICTDDPNRRIAAIKDYLTVCHQVIEDGIPLIGYIFWSTFDNFEWKLGNTYRFGLVTVDWKTMNRTVTSAADFYQKVTEENRIEV